MTKYYRNLCILAVIATCMCLMLSIIFSIVGVAYSAFITAFMAFLLATEATEKYDRYREWKALERYCGAATTFIGPTTAYVDCKACEGDNCEHYKCKYSVIHFDELNETLSFTCGRKGE